MRTTNPFLHLFCAPGRSIQVQEREEQVDTVDVDGR
jgi:hypothetical protein